MDCVSVLSARSEETDKVLGLSMGADDYVTKPYNPRELAARVKSQLRRYTSLGDIHASERENEICNGRLCYRLDERMLYADGGPVRLTATELRIMDLLMRNRGRIFPAEEIYQRVWEEECYAPENTVIWILGLYLIFLSFFLTGSNLIFRLTEALVLPRDHDLHEMADLLNEIQQGMQRALEEQMRSERRWNSLYPVKVHPHKGCFVSCDFLT